MSKIAPELAKSSRELSDASAEANTKGAQAIQYTRDVANVLQGFQGGGLDLKTFGQIRELVEEKKARKALGLAREMDDMALDMAKKAKHMTETLAKSAQDIIPENVRDDLMQEGTTTSTTKTRGVGDGNDDGCNDEEASALMVLLGHADSDVEEVKTNTRSMEQVDIFTAGNTGRDAFSKVADKENVAVKIFQEIKSVSDTILETLAVGASGDSLCAQLFVGLTGIQAMFKALRLSKLIERALITVRKILEAFISFINTSWDKFQKFFDEFDAGKKLERFTDGIKNSFVGKVGKIGNVFG